MGWLLNSFPLDIDQHPLGVVSPYLLWQRCAPSASTLPYQMTNRSAVVCCKHAFHFTFVRVNLPFCGECVLTTCISYVFSWDKNIIVVLLLMMVWLVVLILSLSAHILGAQNPHCGFAFDCRTVYCTKPPLTCTYFGVANSPLWGYGLR